MTIQLPPPTRTQPTSSMVSMVAFYHRGPGFKSREGRELLILDKKQNMNSNLNCNIVYLIHAQRLDQVEHTPPNRASLSGI